MLLPFYKYQATGNDFVIINQMQVKYLKNPSPELVAKLCDRRFGIGADGLMLLEPHSEHCFNMVYYNSDGRQSTMCGNGGRAISHLAHEIQLFETQTTFQAIDGPHDVHITEDGEIALKMIDVDRVVQQQGDYIIDTGSPHYLIWKDDLESIDIVKSAHEIRYNDTYRQEGINVNFIKVIDGTLHIRTYERGVEDETLSCGTAVTAAVLAWATKDNLPEGTYAVKAQGGDLKVTFQRSDLGFVDCWLHGPAVKVFEGNIDISL